MEILQPTRNTFRSTHLTVGMSEGTQRVNYNFNVQEVAIRPFVFAGMSWGSMALP